MQIYEYLRGSVWLLAEILFGHRPSETVHLLPSDVDSTELQPFGCTTMFLALKHRRWPGVSLVLLVTLSDAVRWDTSLEMFQIFSKIGALGSLPNLIITKTTNSMTSFASFSLFPSSHYLFCMPEGNSK